jgi:hypothetical protein
MRKNRVLLVLALTLTLLFGIAAGALPKATDQIGTVTVHEWGTFTSIAGEDGSAMLWQAYGGPTDLPCFVDRFNFIKGAYFGTVRMETPVLYFYASRESKANVRVLFPKGVISEWYPSAARKDKMIEWRDVRITPDAAAEFPVESSPSHYYAARHTDASPLQAKGQQEKFLFYRGVGSFPLPISAMSTKDGAVVLKNDGPYPINGVVHFENRHGTVRYSLAGNLEKQMTLNSSKLHAGLADLEKDLRAMLISHGLYEKEAQAMIDTWRDSWFEEGTRVFYLVPQNIVDSVLPLNVEPAPAQTVRVFVGRMEIITDAIKEDVAKAVADNDRGTLEKYGRFLQPIVSRIHAKSPLIDSISESYFSRTASCSRGE